MYPFRRHPELQLFNPNVDAATGERQMVTVAEILIRFERYPGLILADEVGMGKTFVALGVATSIALSKDCVQPVVIMVPSGLMDKWPADFNAFKEHCLSEEAAKHVRCKSAGNVLDFLKLLDDKPSERAHIIFLKHGAINATRSDRWVKLAVIRRAMKRRRGMDEVWRALDRFIPFLVRDGESLERRYPGMLKAMLHTPVRRWLKIAHQHGYTKMNDDPVPEAVIERLFQEMVGRDFEPLLAAIKSIPRRHSKHLQHRLKETRATLEELADFIWSECARHIPENLPLLILDEAHHTKNARTRLASLFHESGQKDAGQLTRVFERMLFLTATPFQLGHNELCSILRRFDGIRWDGQYPPVLSALEYEATVVSLHEALDASQLKSRRLDETWGRLTASDLLVNGVHSEDEDRWWKQIQASNSTRLTTNQIAVKEASVAAQNSKHASESLLRELVIRHIRNRQLAPGVLRRIRHSGDLIRVASGSPAMPDGSSDQVVGLDVDEHARLPFLLAARHAIRNRAQRAVFAEGLASSYHTFLRTHPATKNGENKELLDEDDAGVKGIDGAHEDWHLNNLYKILQAGENNLHPKLSHTVERVIDLWEQGESVLVFCHFVQTGRDLHRSIALAMEERIRQIASRALSCRQEDVEDELVAIGRQFDASKENSRGARLKEVFRNELFEVMRDLDELSAAEKERFVDVIYRYLRTPSFLVRFFPLSKKGQITESSLRAALDKQPRRFDASGEALHLSASGGEINYETLRDSLRTFIEFQEKKSDETSRAKLLDTLDATQSGRIRMKHDGEGETFLPNVRLVNGSTKRETRTSLMQTFNTPFFPEVLVASAVMSEGVDLHRNCRHVIHHDLCWIPSTLEQRTGRVDRIQSKGERITASVAVFLPFLKATQDEKMYRVVMDRERWFNIVMGDEVKMDTASTEVLAERIPLPPSMQEELSYDLSVYSEKPKES